MFSMLINSVKSLLGVQSDEEPDIDELIGRFQDAITIPEQLEAPEDNNNGPGCFYKTGTITSISSEDVLIDDLYLSNLTNTYISNLQVGMKVNYLAYKKNNDELKIRKILAIHNDAWDNFAEDNQPPTIHNQMMKKFIVAKVMKREGRRVFLEPMNIVIDLDTIDSTFIPYVGDWLRVESLVEVDELSTDLGGTVLEIDRIQPLRSNLMTGNVNEWDARSGVGVIEGNIVFSKLACQPGYTPVVGDKVVCDCIESDQGKYTWRCLSVVPLSQIVDNNNASPDKNVMENILELMKNKNGVFITDDLTFNLEVGEEKVLDVIVKNSSNYSQIFLRGIFMSKKSQSQLSLNNPKIDEVFTLKPSESMTFNFKCRAKFVGSTEELFIFSFKNFKIGRNFKITVNAKNYSEKTEIIHGSRKNKLAKQDNYDQENYIPGIRPCKPPNFITVRSSTFRVPQKLWKLVLEITNERMSQIEGEVMLGEEIPSLIDRLKAENYSDRFHTLLYLEEISLAIDMQKYDMDSAFFRPIEDYLVLTVPGLSEKRPSLMIGDRAIVTCAWDSSGGNLKYEGCIHKITSNEVFMKFNQRFQENYNGEDCQVTFKSTYSSISRCHNAVNLAVANLTREILFPTCIKEKDPQIICEEIEIKKNNQQPEINRLVGHLERIKAMKEKIILKELEARNPLKKPIGIEAEIRQRKLKWFNENLNVYQKQAVKNILHGVARPLPYIIFGPPGTGKTITLCEAILQILVTIPESRLLIATPSNSSANLIAERLLDSGALKPGDMVRLIAHHCLQDDSIPDRLLPYCATGNLAAEGSARKFEHTGDGPRINCTTSVLGRHRITIGTCIALGLLYNMGFPKGHFSHILVDEAGQATEPEILVPLTLIHANQGQIILAGDPMQLGPVVNSRLASAFGLGESFLMRLLHQFPYQRDPEGFERGYDPRLVTKLVMNYRSLPEILELPNSLFYDSELKAQVSPVNSQEANILKLLEEDLPLRNGRPPAIVFHGVNGENKQDPDSPSWYNPAEATQVYLYLLKFYGHGLSGDDIGVITPYQKQVRQIRDLLMELDVSMPKVGSVEEFQGQERKIIILSAVRSTQNYIDEDIRHTLGFVASPRRLNVAITRARALLIILGNPQLLRQDPYWRSVLMYCVKNQSYTGCNFESAGFDENVREMLEFENLISDDILADI